MKPIPYVLLNCAMSLDGYLDDVAKDRLILSNAQDLDRVDELRASSDAILVGANTIRKDNPRLLIRSKERQINRQKRGYASHPIKVTITRSGTIPESSLFLEGDTKKFIYTAASNKISFSNSITSKATVIGMRGKIMKLQAILEDLYKRGIRKLMVEGGSSILTQFLEEGYVNELQVAIAPFFVGDSFAPRFLNDGHFSWNVQHPMKLKSIHKFGDCVVLRYIL